MRFLTFALGTLLVAATPAHAQAPAAAPAPLRYYVGLGAYHSNYQNLAVRHGETGFPVPVQLAAGYQLRPRLVLELSAAYRGLSSATSSDGVIFNSAGTSYYFSASSTATERTTTVAALARFTLTQQSARRLQFDVLGGVGVVHGNWYARGSRTEGYAGSLETVSFAQRSTANNWLLTAGLATRYCFSPRVALNLDIATNRDLTYPDFIGSAALGLRYRFGR